MGVFGSVISERLYIGFNKKKKKNQGPISELLGDQIQA